jgi:N-hydroxyarylamine O-acetyltransferase
MILRAGWRAKDRPALIDLTTYLARIGFVAPLEPTLDTLRALHLHHTLAIPFENLDPFLGHPVHLDEASLTSKLLGAGRGGYCYEHNCLFMSVLGQLGFRVTGLAARVLLNVPAGAVRPRTHMLLRVDLPDAIYLSDVGFGGLTPTAPLRLAPGSPQRTLHETFRVQSQQGAYLVQAQLPDGWKSLYSFELTPQLLPDYEAMSWYVSNHPDSYFRNSLMVARNSLEERYTLFGNQLAVHAVQGTTRRQSLGSATELRAALTRIFQIRLPEAPELDQALSRLTVISAKAD